MGRAVRATEQVIVRKHKCNFTILIMTLVLMAIGLIVIYAIGPMRANVLNSTYGTDYDSNYFFVRQLLSVGLAIFALFAGFKIPYGFLRRIAKIILILGIFLCVLLWILAEVGSGMAKCELGECRWYNLGAVSFQPAEFLKVGLILYLADFLARKREERAGFSFKEFWMPILVVFGIALALVVIVEGDLGTGVAILAILIGMILASGAPRWQCAVMTVVILVGGGLAMVTSAHRMERVEAWLTTLSGGESSDSTYHIENAMMAIGMGGLFGVGIGNSVQATGYLPESINDSVFAVMGETFGFVGLIAILGIFAALLFKTLGVAERTVEFSQRMVVVGVFCWVAAQVVVNIMAMTSLVPVTGITLPLLSYGGTSMLFVAFSIGMVLQISCYTSREVIQDEDISGRRGVGGTYHSSRRRSA